MFGSDILDVVIALSFTYFLLAIVASAGQEIVAQATSWRAKTLKAGIGRLLADPTFQGLAGKVYSHPLIASLDQPSYLRNTRFADSLLDSLSTAEAAKETSIETVLAGIDALPEGSAKTQLQVLVRQGGDTLEGLRQAVAAWFDEGMERLSGAYKRNSRKVLLALGLGMAVLFNIDTIAMAQALAANPSIRAAIVQSAGTVTGSGGPTTTPTDAIRLLDGLEPGIGWSVCWYPSAENDARPATDLPAPCGQNLGGRWPPGEAWINYVVLRIPGWVFTALAVMLGAPFWFDILNKLVDLRATGKKVD
jgi:hypothetical protein